MIQNKIVIRYNDGRVLKGYTGDFLPTKPTFHLALIDSPPTSKPVEVKVGDLKAIFFVKDLVGDAKRVDVQEFLPGKVAVGRKIRVIFRDGERLVGTTQGYDPTRQGFFVVPADVNANNERCFVVKSATRDVTFL